jgi:glutaredoxin
MPNIKVYGADWCDHTRSTLQYLDEIGAPYEYIDVDDDPQASKWVKNHNNGKEKKPTLDVDGRVISMPSRDEIDELLKAGIGAQPSGK